MFERFTKEARGAVIGAQQEARALSSRTIGTEHLLLALLDGEGPAAEALRGQGLRAGPLRATVARRSGTGDLDADALRTLGIDLDAVRRAAEDSFGEGALDAPAGRFRKGHIPFTAESKKALELSLRHAVRLKHQRLGTGHILLGVLHDGGSEAARVLGAEGVDLASVRAEVTRLLEAEAA
ncbi:Clp protease N-terminal domain-containing protein [Actinomadura viridis]|uniref:ATP-dependent Clp protease ATP-binding subunit ClpA n=1 Tax=Actinomadura viridis TaxID=58110 RepID=A0A931GMJ7_9ACTN|nr:Clp protease N-terminal domain-containing protein [Actinomadura viridis]MBG6088566.1 ATP-dependent Clp protease ATP-binding subunit ClpA [Actinomadura viridis]